MKKLDHTFFILYMMVPIIMAAWMHAALVVFFFFFALIFSDLAFYAREKCKRRTPEKLGRILK